MKVGVCFFDDHELGSSGWCSIDGSDPERIKDFGDLRTDIQWITNLDYKTYKKLGLTNVNHIYDEQFYRTSVKLLIEELGLIDQADIACEKLSMIFSNTARIMEDKLSLTPNGMRYRLAPNLTATVLPNELRKRPSGRNSPDVSEAIKQAVQQNQNSLGITPPAGSKARPFTFPRAEYFNHLMRLPVPISDKWTDVKQSKSEMIIGTENGHLINGTKAVIDKLNDWSHDEAYIFKIKLLSIDKSHRSFATFGHGSWDARSYATLPEILSMVKYSKIALLGGYKTKLGTIDFNEDIFDSEMNFSISYGLYLENIWTSISCPIIGTKFNTAVSAYMRAYDRSYCIDASESFHQNNYVVGSSGSGRVMVYTPRGSEADICNIALKNNCCPPLSLYN